MWLRSWNEHIEPLRAQTDWLPVYIHRAEWGACAHWGTAGSGHWIPPSATLNDFYDIVLKDYATYGYPWVLGSFVVCYPCDANPSLWIRPRHRAFTILPDTDQLFAQEAFTDPSDEIYNPTGKNLWLALPDKVITGGLRVHFEYFDERFREMEEKEISGSPSSSSACSCTSSRAVGSVLKAPTGSGAH